jgi:hypothetical protein
LTFSNLEEFNLISAAVLIMTVGQPLGIATSRLTGQIVSGYVDGLCLPIDVDYSKESLELLQARLKELGIITEFSYTRRRLAVSPFALVIPNANLPIVKELLGHFVLPDYQHLLEPAQHQPHKY